MGNPISRTGWCERCGGQHIYVSSRSRKYCDECLPIVRQLNRVAAARSQKHIESVRRIGKANKGRVLETRDTNHHNWKGDNVGKDSLHSWVIRRLGKPQKCEVCETTESNKFDWANLSQKYRRDLTDWKRMCRSCHLKYDYRQGVRHGKKATI